MVFVNLALKTRLVSTICPISCLLTEKNGNLAKVKAHEIVCKQWARDPWLSYTLLGQVLDALRQSGDPDPKTYYR